MHTFERDLHCGKMTNTCLDPESPHSAAAGADEDIAAKCNAISKGMELQIQACSQDLLTSCIIHSISFIDKTSL